MMKSSRMSDYDWFMEHDFSQYAGEWIAILNKQVVEHGKDAGKIIEVVKKKYPGKRPSLVKIDHRRRVLQC